MRITDHYRTLGVSRFATHDQVRQAYIKLVKHHHTGPQKSTLSEDRLRQIGMAYWELRHPDRRSEYDAQLQAAQHCHRRKVQRVLRATPRLFPSNEIQPHRMEKWLFGLILPLLGIGVACATQHAIPLPTAPADPVRVMDVTNDARLLKQLDGDRTLVAMLNEQRRIQNNIDHCLISLRQEDSKNARRFCPAMEELKWGDDPLAGRFQSMQDARSVVGDDNQGWLSMNSARVTP